MNDSEIITRRQGIGCPSIIKEKGTSDTLALDNAKLAADTGSAGTPTQNRFQENYFRAYSSADTIGYETSQQTSHSCVSIDNDYGRLLLHQAREHDDWNMDH